MTDHLPCLQEPCILAQAQGSFLPPGVASLCQVWAQTPVIQNKLKIIEVDGRILFPAWGPPQEYRADSRISAERPDGKHSK